MEEDFHNRTCQGPRGFAISANLAGGAGAPAVSRWWPGTGFDQLSRTAFCNGSLRRVHRAKPMISLFTPCGSRLKVLPAEVISRKEAAVRDEWG